MKKEAAVAAFSRLFFSSLEKQADSLGLLMAQKEKNI